MPEGLSSDEQAEAQRLRSQEALSRLHVKAVEELAPAKTTDELEQLEKVVQEYGPASAISVEAQRELTRHKQLEELAKRRDNLSQASSEDKEENLDKYIATAKNEAEAAGHEIKLDPETQAAQDRLEEQEQAEEGK